MTYQPKTSETFRDCKLKAVNPPFRSVSTPRARKDLRVVGRVNPDTGARALRLRLDFSESNARRLARRLPQEPNPDASQRLSMIATEHGRAGAQFPRHGLSERR